jgi:hypothetical protein
MREGSSKGHYPAPFLFLCDPDGTPRIFNAGSPDVVNHDDS